MVGKGHNKWYVKQIRTHKGTFGNIGTQYEVLWYKCKICNFEAHTKKKMINHFVTTHMKEIVKRMKKVD